MRFSVDRVGAHVYSDVDGGTDTLSGVDVAVWAQRDVRAGPAFESKGNGVVAAVRDRPEKYLQRGRGFEEVFGEEPVETAVRAGEGGKVL